MSNIEKTRKIKEEIAGINKKIVEKQYDTLNEKHDLQKRRWILKRLLSAIENESDCEYLDLFMN